MFIKLNALRNNVSSLGLAITFLPDDRINVIVTPVVKEEALIKNMSCLATPFALTGTPAEMEAGFADQFGCFATVFTDLVTQSNQQIEDIKAKAKADADAATAKKAKTLPGPKGKLSNSAEALAGALSGGEPADNEDDEDEGESPSSSLVTTSNTATAAKPAEVSADLTADQLFG